MARHETKRGAIKPTGHHGLVLPAEVRRQISIWAAAGHPDEACGLLIGRARGNRFQVVRASCARNLETDRPRDRYTLAPDDWVAAESRAKTDGLDVIGVWHSHPDHPAEPSQTDLEAAWEDYSYLILSVTPEGVTDLRSWRLFERAFEEQVIEETN